MVQLELRTQPFNLPKEAILSNASRPTCCAIMPPIAVQGSNVIRQRLANLPTTHKHQRHVWTACPTNLDGRRARLYLEPSQRSCAVQSTASSKEQAEKEHTCIAWSLLANLRAQHRDYRTLGLGSAVAVRSRIRISSELSRAKRKRTSAR